MNNYSRAIEAQVTALTSAGDALASFKIMQDTTAVKITQMQNTWTQLAKTIGDTTVFKFAIDTLKNLAEGLIRVASATDYLAMKLREKKQGEIDDISLILSKVEALKEIEKIETRLSKNPTENNKKLSEKLAQSKKSILEANPGLAALDTNSLNYRMVRDEIERERSKEIIEIENAEKALRKKPNWMETSAEEDIIIKSREAIIKKYGSVAGARKKLYESFDAEARSRLAVKGINGINFEVEDAKNMEKADKSLQTKKEAAELAQHEANMMKIKGASEKEVLEYMIKQYETQNLLITAEEKRAKLTQLRYELEEKNLQQIYEYSNKIESTLSDSIKNMMTGTGNFSDLLSNLNKARTDMFRETVSDTLAKSIMSTGIGTGFGTAMLSLKGKIEAGHQTVYKWIVKGHSDGIKSAQGDKAAMLATWKDGGGGFGDLGVLSLLAANPNIIRGGRGGTDTGMQMINDVMAPTWSPYSSSGKGTRKGGGGVFSEEFGKIAGGVAQGAMIGYTAYQSGLAGGLNPGMNAASAGLMAVGTALTPTPLAPIGIALNLIGMALQMFGGKKSKEDSTQTQTTENRLSSKIDVTNKNLEIINRNLIGMRNDIRTYILPQSAYWSTKDSLDDEFSLSARRGQF
jgi:hypothetical protein